MALNNSVFFFFDECITHVFIFPTIANTAFFFVLSDRYWRFFSSHVFCFRITIISLNRTKKNTNSSVYFFLCTALSLARKLFLSLIMFFAASRALSLFTCTYICFLTVIENEFDIVR